MTGFPHIRGVHTGWLPAGKAYGHLMTPVHPYIPRQIPGGLLVAYPTEPIRPSTIDQIVAGLLFVFTVILFALLFVERR